MSRRSVDAHRASSKDRIWRSGSTTTSSPAAAGTGWCRRAARWPGGSDPRLQRSAPGRGVRAVAPDLEDVYFLAIHDERARAAAAPPRARLPVRRPEERMMLASGSRRSSSEAAPDDLDATSTSPSSSHRLLSHVRRGGGVLERVRRGRGRRRSLINAPYRRAVDDRSAAYLGSLMSAAVFGQAVHQDIESQDDATSSSRCPSRSASYLGGRFLGALVFGVWCSRASASACSPGASCRSGRAPAASAPRGSPPIVWPYLTIVLPNLRLHRRRVLRARRALAADDAGVRRRGDHGGRLPHRGRLTRDIDNRTLAAMLDPFGNAADGRDHRVLDRRREELAARPLHRPAAVQPPALGGPGAALFAFTFARFRFARPARRSGRARPWSLRRARARGPPRSGGPWPSRSSTAPRSSSRGSRGSPSPRR